MKGIVFTELLKMAEDAFGEEVVDGVLDQTDLLDDGAYTAVGNYPCSELMKIVQGFSTHSGISPEVLQQKFGHWMWAVFSDKYPEFMADKENSFAMLEAIDGEIHVEVRKLYPDAELPKFNSKRRSEDHLELEYTSPRPLVPFCHGLIEACTQHFKETVDISLEQTSGPVAGAVFQIEIKS